MDCKHPDTALETCVDCGRPTALVCAPRTLRFPSGAYKEGEGCCAVLARYPHAPGCRFAPAHEAEPRRAA